MMKVHFNTGGGRTACGAEDIWKSRGGSSVITSNKDREAVTCGNCKRSWTFNRG